MIYIGKIQVIDAPCGWGKTSWAIQEMNAHPEQSYIFCTPYLDEIKRVRKACGYERFVAPTNNGGITKLDSFNDLLSSGKDICVTHATFLNATPETMSLIAEGGYTLILDEAIDAVKSFNDVQSVDSNERQKMNATDMDDFIANNLLKIYGDNKVVWSGVGGVSGEDSKMSEVKKFADLGRLYCTDGKELLVTFPPELFDVFENVYVMTYMFGGVLLCPYFQKFNIDYECLSVKLEEDKYSLVPYDDTYDIFFRKEFRRLVTVYPDDRFEESLPYSKRPELSSNWYKRSTKAERDVLKSNIYNFFHNKMRSFGSKCENVMWTCPKDYKKQLSGQGYTCLRKLTKEENELPKADRDKLSDELSRFVACNARATNKYSDRWALAYCCNMFIKPEMKAFFKSENQARIKQGLDPVEVNEDLYALASIIQWVYRSRIRKHDLPDSERRVYLYIPSKRMRDLIVNWMTCKDI